jgi:hypothetical protein
MTKEQWFTLDDHIQAGNVLVNSLDSLHQLIDTIGAKHSKHDRQAEQVIRHIERTRMALLIVTTTLQIEMERTYPQALGLDCYRHSK